MFVRTTLPGLCRSPQLERNQEALKEKERLANLRTQSEGTKPSDALNVDDDEEVVDFSDQPSRGAGRAAITSEPSPKRARRGKGKVTDSPSGMASSAATGKASRSTAGASDVNLPDLDAQDRALLAKRDKQAKELEKLKISKMKEAQEAERIQKEKE